MSDYFDTWCFDSVQGQFLSRPTSESSQSQHQQCRASGRDDSTLQWLPVYFLSFVTIAILSLVCVLVAQSCPTICNPVDYSPSGSSVHRVLPARTLEWVTIPFSRCSSQPRDQTRVSCTAGGFFTIWAIREESYSFSYYNFNFIFQI